MTVENKKDVVYFSVDNWFCGRDMISCRNEPDAYDFAFSITTEEAKTHCCENYSDIPVVYELPAQTEIPAVISVPRAEMCSNALLFYNAFRGLCRMRIKYAQFMSEGFEQMNINETITEEWISKKMEFWAKVKAYWEGKLELSYKWEKDYFGRK